jgi:transposase
MQLEPIHERAIDLLVSGRRQIAVAKELNVSTRTLRRWGAEPEFIAELQKQHELSRKLTAAAEDEVRKQRREVQIAALKQIRNLIEDEKTPESLRTECLRIVHDDQRQWARQEAAQEWREFLYYEKQRQEEERKAAEAAFMAKLAGAMPADGGAVKASYRPMSAPHHNGENRPKADTHSRPQRK